MRKKKTLFSLIGLSAAALLFSFVWINSGNTCTTPVCTGAEKTCLDRQAGDCGKRERAFPANRCKGNEFVLKDVCANLPSSCGVLCKKDDLGLGDGQLAKLKQLKSSARKNKIKQLADIQILKLELQELLDKTAVDKKALEAKLDAIGSLRTRIAKDCINSKLAARKVLTAEQLKKWETSRKACKVGAGSACDRHAPGGKG